MTVCNFSVITGDIDKNCQNVIPGRDDTMYAIPYDYVDKANCVFNVDNPLILETLVLKTNSPSYSAFKIVGQKMSNGGAAILANSKYQTGYTHEATFVILDNDPVTKKRVAEYANTKVMIIHKNLYNNSQKVGTPSDSLYELSGWDAGLYLTEANNNNADAAGGWYLKVATSGDAKESMPPLTIFKTDAETTEAAILALL